jgi:hypothetical protein
MHYISRKINDAILHHPRETRFRFKIQNQYPKAKPPDIHLKNNLKDNFL